MAVFLLVARHYADMLTAQIFHSTLLTLIVVCVSGLAVFAVAALGTGAFRLSEVRAALKRT
jgi:putative peptidoglycan lipid II flippase